MRLWTRRFNQAAALAGAVARRVGKPLRTFFARPREGDAQPGRPQPGTAGGQCPGRLSGSACGAKSVKGRRIVLVDDVLTSGATANAAARALCGAGPASRPARVRAGCDRINVTSHIRLIFRGVIRQERKPALPPIAIYTKASCPYCHAAKALLQRRRAQRLRKSASMATAPGKPRWRPRAGGRWTFRRFSLAIAMSGAATTSIVERGALSTASCGRMHD